MLSAPPTVFKGNVYFPIFLILKIIFFLTYEPPIDDECAIGNAYICVADDECGTNNSHKLTIRKGVLSYGLITNTYSNGQTIYTSDLTGLVINNYSGATISATANDDSNNATKGAINTDATNISSNVTINNWGTITAAHDTVVLGTTNTINNYGKIESVNFSDSPAIVMKGNNNTVNLYENTGGSDCHFVREGILSELVIFGDKLFANVAGPKEDARTLYSVLAASGEVGKTRGSWREVGF